MCFDWGRVRERHDTEAQIIGSSSASARKRVSFGGSQHDPSTPSMPLSIEGKHAAKCTHPAWKLLSPAGTNFGKSQLVNHCGRTSPTGALP